MTFLLKAKHYLNHEQFEILREIFLSIIISTLVSTSVGFYFNKKMDERISNRQFIYDFSRVFNDNPKYRSVSIAIEEQYLYEKEDKIPSITEYDLDDYLGLLSDIWAYHRDGFISKDMLNDRYGYALCLTLNSKLINAYRERLTKQGFSDNYIFLDRINDELKLKDTNCKLL